MTKLVRLVTCAASRDTTRGIAGIAKAHLMEGRLMARERAMERPSVKVAARAVAK